MILTARSETEGRIDALDIGADDSSPKLFNFREFDACCRALLHRSQGMASGTTKTGRLEFDRGSRTMRLDEELLVLPNREFQFLEFFFGNVGRVLDTDKTASQLFGFDSEVDPNAIGLCLGGLWRKLGDALTIKTLRGLGYMAEDSRHEKS